MAPTRRVLSKIFTCSFDLYLVFFSCNHSSTWDMYLTSCFFPYIHKYTWGGTYIILYLGKYIYSIVRIRGNIVNEYSTRLLDKLCTCNILAAFLNIHAGLLSKYCSVVNRSHRFKAYADFNSKRFHVLLWGTLWLASSYYFNDSPVES